MICRHCGEEIDLEEGKTYYYHSRTNYTSCANNKAGYYIEDWSKCTVFALPLVFEDYLTEALKI